MTYIHALKPYWLHISLIFDLSTRFYLKSFTCNLNNFKYKDISRIRVSKSLNLQ